MFGQMIEQNTSVFRLPSLLCSLVLSFNAFENVTYACYRAFSQTKQSTIRTLSFYTTAVLSLLRKDVT